jgi:L-ascorbate metabolism protein UlaG (beta-lactamase superfamily)
MFVCLQITSLYGSCQYIEHQRIFCYTHPMIITYQGIEFVKIQHGDTVLAFNPVSKTSKFKTPRFGADVALVTLNHPDMNGVDTVGLGDKQPFVIKGPGEYEIKELFIKGFGTSSTYGDEDKFNTIYSLVVDNINVCFLGALGKTEISPEARTAMGEADVLFVPIGSEGVLSASIAYQMAVKVEPKIIIPIHFGEVGDKSALKTFLKEADAEEVKPIDKLTLKKKDLDGKEAEVVVLEALM